MVLVGGIEGDGWALGFCFLEIRYRRNEGF